MLFICSERVGWRVVSAFLKRGAGVWRCSCGIQLVGFDLLHCSVDLEAFTRPVSSYGKVGDVLVFRLGRGCCLQ